jgi:hypothetical protein
LPTNANGSEVVAPELTNTLVIDCVTYAGWEAVTVYVPGGTPLKVYAPVGPVVALPLP